MTIEEGDRAPDFELPDQDGATVRLKDLKGRPVVLFFYPKDDTSGCTLEAVGFTQALDAFQKLDVAVFGVSRDDEASHVRFRKKHDLAVPLLADTDLAAIKAFDVWREKSLYGRKFMGVERSTFLIDGKGRIAKAWRKVRVPGHVDKVLEAARALA